MKISEYALHLLLSSEIEDKLLPPPAGLEDLTEELPLRIEKPNRSAILKFSDQKAKIPRLEHLNQVSARGLTLHHFANHELMAIELFAWALLAFPSVSKRTKLGFLKTINEEQAHLRLYLNRMNDFGIGFGDIPLNYIFWKQIPYMTSVEKFSAILSLTFEGANLDYAQIYAKAFSHFGDQKTSDIMIQIFEDEIKHVKRGFKIIRSSMDTNDSEWETYLKLISFPLTPRRAKAYFYLPETRRMAGLSVEFASALGEYSDEYTQKSEKKGQGNISLDTAILRKTRLPGKRDSL